MVEGASREQVSIERLQALRRCVYGMHTAYDGFVSADAAGDEDRRELEASNFATHGMAFDGARLRLKNVVSELEYERWWKVAGRRLRDDPVAKLFKDTRKWTFHQSELALDHELLVLPSARGTPVLMTDGDLPDRQLPLPAVEVHLVTTFVAAEPPLDRVPAVQLMEQYLAMIHEVHNSAVQWLWDALTDSAPAPWE